MTSRNFWIVLLGFGFLVYTGAQENDSSLSQQTIDSAASVRESLSQPISKTHDTATEQQVTDTVHNTVSDSMDNTEDEILLVGDEEIPEEMVVDTLAPIEKMPELKEFIEAAYPEELVKQGIQGTVLMELLVSDSGTVDSVTLLRGIHPVLDSSARSAARHFLFSPAVAGGEAVPVLIQYEYRFSLEEVVEKIESYINLSGRLLEQGTKRPITNAMVVLHFPDTLSDTTLPVPFSLYLARIAQMQGQYLEENRLVTLTDSLGRFSFYSLPAGVVEITAPLSGYESFKEREFIPYNEEKIVTYYIRRVSYSDYEIVVYGKTEEKEVSRRRLNITEVKKIPGLGGDAIKVVQALPGVGRPTFGSGQVVVRGAPTWDSRFFLDGVEIPLLYHFGGLKSTYNSDALESIDFYPGGFSTRYGGAVAGIIEVTGRKAKEDRWKGYADMSFLDGAVMAEGPVKKSVSAMISGRRSFAGEVISWAIDNADLNIPFTVQPFYWDYLFRIDAAVSKKNSVFVTAFGSKDKLEFIYPSVQGGSASIDDQIDRLKHQTEFHMGIVGWNYAILDNLENSLRYSFLYGDAFTSIFGFMKSVTKTYSHYIRDELAYTLSDALKINVGTDITFSTNDIEFKFFDNNQIGGIETVLWQDSLFGDIAAYVNFEWKPIEKLLVIPGLRFDYFPELHYDGSLIPEFWNYDFMKNDRGISGEPSLRLICRYTFRENHTAKCAVGNYSQTPRPIGQVIDKDWGDPMMPATKAAHYVAGYEWQITDLINLDAQGYFNRQWDVPRLATSSDANKEMIWARDGKKRMYGLELMLRHDNSERFFGWVSYSLARSETFDYKENRWALYDEDITNHLQVLGSWHLKRDWDVGFRLRYTTGKPQTPIVATVYNEENKFFEPIYGEKNSNRVNPFVQLDLRVDKKYIYNKWIFSTYIDLQNVSWFLYKSPEFFIYNYDYSDKQTISGIFIPAIGTRVEF